MQSNKTSCYAYTVLKATGSMSYQLLPDAGCTQSNGCSKLEVAAPTVLGMFAVQAGRLSDLLALCLHWDMGRSSICQACMYPKATLHVGVAHWAGRCLGPACVMPPKIFLQAASGAEDALQYQTLQPGLHLLQCYLLCVPCANTLTSCLWCATEAHGMGLFLPWTVTFLFVSRLVQQMPCWQCLGKVPLL